MLLLISIYRLFIPFISLQEKKIYLLKKKERNVETQKMKSQATYDYIVIGAGFSGLYLCLRLLEKKERNCSILLLEKNLDPGGRLQTETDESGNVLFERGAWRVPQEENHGALRRFLSDELKIQLVPIPSKGKIIPPVELQQESIPDEVDKIDRTGKRDRSTVYGGSVLSQKLWDSSNGIDKCFKEERGTGYSGIWSQPENKNRDRLAYSAREQDGFLAPKLGFSHVISTLLRRLSIHEVSPPYYPSVPVKNGVTLLVGANVLDIVQYKDPKKVVGTQNKSQVQFQRWNVKGTPVVSAEARCAVFVAVPPHASMNWPFFHARTRLLHACVTSLPLCHVYAKLKPGFRVFDDGQGPENGHVVLPDSFLQQVSLLPQYEDEKIINREQDSIHDQQRQQQQQQQWIQVSYSAGRVASTWRDWSLQIPSKDLLFKVQSELTQVIEKGKLAWAVEGPETASTSSSSLQFLEELKICFWERAVHYFRPGLGFNAQDVVTKCRTPNRRDYPDVFVLGEAYSNFQGWLQGCIQTADLALQAALDSVQHHHGTESPLPNSEVETSSDPESRKMVINSWVLDFKNNPLLRDWMHLHPGGEQAILNHLGEKESLGSLLRVQHSETALASALYLAENV